MLSNIHLATKYCLNDTCNTHQSSQAQNEDANKLILYLKEVLKIHTPQSNFMQDKKNGKQFEQASKSADQTSIAPTNSEDLEQVLQKNPNLNSNITSISKYLDCNKNSNANSNEVNISSNKSPITKYEKTKAHVLNAVQNGKTFIMYNSNAVRSSLIKRGWVEKISINRTWSDILQNTYKMSIKQLIKHLNDPVDATIYKRVLTSKLLSNHLCDLIWDPTPIMYNIVKNVKKPVYMNCFRKSKEHDFTTKIGLCKRLRELHWNYQENVSDVYFPRTYILSEDEMNDFIYDFQITACICLLKWLIERSRIKKPILSQSGRIPIDVLYFAILQCFGYIRYLKDLEFKLYNSFETWSKYFNYYYKCVYRGEHFSTVDTNINSTEFINQATDILEQIKMYRSDLNVDGKLNMWILKPDQRNRGEGIQICKSMTQIKGIINTNTDMKYIIQKYIERPLLIYQTKFDIRQWFLISSSCPLTVYIYKECYLRFSSQNYDLNKYHESIHLTNNCIQTRYKISTLRNPKLPKDNMWDLNRFQTYLKTLHKAKAWNDIIYPKMKQAILAVILSAKDGIEKRPYSFELYGADFLLTTDFQPWLLEINAHPAMSHSTPVTSKMCPEVLENVIQLIFDKNVGKFELIYQEPDIATSDKTFSEDCSLHGIPLTIGEFAKIDSFLKKLTKIKTLKKCDETELPEENNETVNIPLDSLEIDDKLEISNDANKHTDEDNNVTQNKMQDKAVLEPLNE